MIVSWDWLKEYVSLDVSVEEIELRLMMAGLNHEGTEVIDGDPAIDLEVPSNRPDCLGNLGVAREISVLYNSELTIPAADLTEGSEKVESLASVKVECPELCPRYTARVIRGVKIGPSPDWLVQRLKSLGVPAINNVVDISNYVMLECGQPLHTFDLAKLGGGQIVVRQARQGELFQAINHKEYELISTDCVIADAEQPVAIAGVMGGAETEVSATTTDLLIESAAFASVSVRATARRLILHSDSSFRFERSPDPAAVEWASRRCCQLILELAGGELASGMLDVRSNEQVREPITLRYAQLERVLGITIDTTEVRRILSKLGNKEQSADDTSVTVVPPSWRKDLTREIDLVEEVARIHGYDKIPEDSSVPMVPSHRRDEDRVLSKIRHLLVGAGFDEAITPSVVDEATSSAYSPWTETPPLVTSTPMLRGATLLRRSLVPSLLGVRRVNESLGNAQIELFEIAKVYLPSASGLPSEEKMLAISSRSEYFDLKGVVESLVDEICPGLELQVEAISSELIEAPRSAELKLEGDLLGYLGEVSAAAGKKLGLRGKTTVVELRMNTLLAHARLISSHAQVSPYPAVERDINFEVVEAIRWSDLASTVRKSAGPFLEEVRYIETYRDAKRLGADRKSLVLKLILRSNEATLTGEQADSVRKQVEDACGAKHGAVLRA